MQWATIQYRDFYDVPRIFITNYQGQLYLFDCPFDDELDDYQDSYRVYHLPALTEAELEGSWKHLPERASRLLGIIPVTEVQFDPTKRARVNTASLSKLLAWPMPETLVA